MLILQEFLYMVSPALRPTHITTSPNQVVGRTNSLLPDITNVLTASVSTETEGQLLNGEL